MYKTISNYIRWAKSGLRYKSKVQAYSSPKRLHTLKLNLEKKFSVGSTVSGFEVKEVTAVPELQLEVVRLEHVKTGADYVHVLREDSNNVFCVGFRTTPQDSTGVPHILEHSVLCGSRSFPCRDPFFKMLNRSLATFMNAMTGPDYTVYPFSTQNPVDFRNLMSVYLDAVFKPNLTEVDFLQEGWRLEHEDVSDRSSPIVLKGVVWNEMKGVFADPQQVFAQRLQSALLPSHTYGVVSGGDPLRIPDLTWQALKAFHAAHYHPSNARLFSYGDMPLEDHLSFVHTHYLSKYDRIRPSTAVPQEPRWDTPRRAHVACPPDPMAPPDRQMTVGVSFLLADIKDDFENFVLSVLGELLLSGPNAPFYRSLLESGLGSSLCPAAGFDGHTRTTSFTVGLQGVCEGQVEEVLSAIERTLTQAQEEGFPADRVESVLHGLELGLKHETSSFGLGLGLGLTPLRNHSGDPLEALRINAKLTRLRDTMGREPGFLQAKVKQYFSGANAHRLTLTMSPDEGLEKREAEEELRLREAKTKDLSEEERSRIWDLGLALKDKQEAVEDVSCLPTLHVADISRTPTPTPLALLEVAGGVPLQVGVQPTNGVSYFSAVLSTRHLEADLSTWVALFSGVLTAMGAGGMDFRALTQRAELVTGGLSAEAHVASDPSDPLRYEEGILLTSHCLHHNLPAMLDLWAWVLTQPRLEDAARFAALVKMRATDRANGLLHSAHAYAMTGAAAHTRYASFVQERNSGLPQLEHLRQLSAAEDLAPAMDRMRQVAAAVLGKDRMRVALTVSGAHRDEAVRHTEDFLTRLGGTPLGGAESPLGPTPASFAPQTPTCAHHVFPFPVNFASRAFPGVPYTHPDAGPLRVLGRLMFPFLHREIREKGGAYGGGASVSPGGPFCFYSYRDPHSTQTLEVFEAAVEWVLSGAFSQRDVDEAKLGVFQRVDAPVSPGARGMRPFLTHVTDDMLERHRLAILEAEGVDLVRVCREHLKGATRGGACLIGPQNEALSRDPSWTTISH